MNQSNPDPPIRLLIVEDHAMFREGIVQLLSRNEEFSLVAQAEDGPSAVTLALKHQPDIILMDISLPGMDGIETARMMRLNQVRARVVILSMHADRQFQARAMAEKIDGYVLKEQVYLDLITATKTVHSGERYYCPNLGKQRESTPAANIWQCTNCYQRTTNNQRT
jgi:DNA-binding NarL/FixJ family response regulator